MRVRIYWPTLLMLIGVVMICGGVVFCATSIATAQEQPGSWCDVVVFPGGAFGLVSMDRLGGREVRCHDESGAQRTVVVPCRER
jgi:hypothetical protein